MPDTLNGYTYLHTPAKEQDTTVFITLHGTGGSEKDLLPVAQQLDSNAAIISPRGNVEVNGHARYFNRDVDGVFDIEDVTKHSEEMKGFLDAASKEFSFKKDQPIWVGYSNGANMIANMMFLQPGTIKKAILLRPMVTIIPEKIPDISGANIFIAAGRNDSLVPVSSTEHLIRMFQQAGALVELFLHDAGHSLTEEDMITAKMWCLKNNTYVIPSGPSAFEEKEEEDKPENKTGSDQSDIQKETEQSDDDPEENTAEAVIESESLEEEAQEESTEKSS